MNGQPDQNAPEGGQINRRLRLAYDRMAEERSRSEISAWKTAERQRFLDELARAGSRRLLEIGAGHGRDSLFFMAEGLQVISSDLSFRMAQLCRGAGLAALQSDVLDPPFAPASFDAVYALNSLLHIPRARMHRALRGVQRALKSGGLFYVGVYGGKNWEGIWEDDSYRPKRFFSYYGDEDLIALVSDCFEVVSFKAIEVQERGWLHFQSMTLRKA